MKRYPALICASMSLALALNGYSQIPQSGQTKPEPKTPVTKPGPNDLDVVRINTNLVQVDVIVTDDKGHLVTDLKPEDFEVLEEGRPQKITNFSYVMPLASAAKTTKAPADLSIATTDKTGKEKVVKVAAPLPPVPLRPEQVRRTIALVVDDLGLSHESSVRVRESLRKFVREQMQPGDLVAVIRTGAGMGALQQFTTDKQLLEAAIDRVRFNLSSRSDISAFGPIGGDGVAVQVNDSSLAMRTSGVQQQAKDERAPNSFLASPGAKLDQFREELFSVGTLGAMNFIIRGLKGMPGRKSIVLFSDGFKLYSEDPGSQRVLDNLHRLTDLANRASVVIYAIDPRGLQYFGISAADNLNSPIGTFNATPENPIDPSKMTPAELAAHGGPDGAAAYAKSRQYRPADQFLKDQASIDQAISDRRSDFFQSQQGLSYLSSETGGFLVKNNNDINGAIRRVLNDQEGFYLLGYQPAASSFGEDNGHRAFRKISVKVNRPGVVVRTRKGFYGFTEEESRRPIRTPAQQLLAALTSPFKSGDIRLRMTALFGYDPERGPFVQSMVHISADDLSYQEKPDGSRQAMIEIMAVTFGDDGKVLDQDSRGYAIQVNANEYKKAVSEGLIYIVTLPVKKPGIYQLRIGVRDRSTGKLGSANQVIDIPDVKKGRLSVSGLTLRGVSRPTADQPGTVAAAMIPKPTAELNDPQTGPAGRHLKRGMVLNYGFFIYNAQFDKATGLPSLATQLRLFRDGQLVFTGQIKEYPNGQTNQKQLVGGGSFQLGSDLSPGDYVLQVIVIDRLAKNGRQMVSQWTDFDIH